MDREMDPVAAAASCRVSLLSVARFNGNRATGRQQEEERKKGRQTTGSESDHHVDAAYPRPVIIYGSRERFNPDMTRER